VMYPSHICRLRVTIPLSQNHVTTKFYWVEAQSHHKNCWVTFSHWFAHSSQSPYLFSLQNGTQWVKNTVQCCVCSFVTRLFGYKFWWKKEL